jgi:hypothetical protein
VQTHGGLQASVHGQFFKDVSMAVGLSRMPKRGFALVANVLRPGNLIRLAHTNGRFPGSAKICGLRTVELTVCAHT